VRIVLDLQSCQSESKFRGIGRYSMALAKAVARQAGNHEIWLVLNDRFPDTVPAIRHEFYDLVPREHIAVFAVNGPVAANNPRNAWRNRAAERVREYFLAGLHPDVVHVSSLFEGWSDDVVTSITASDQNSPVAVTLYDLIPFLHPESYLQDHQARDYYMSKIQSLRNARCLLAISNYSKQEAIRTLDLREESIVNISSAVDARFSPREVSHDEKQLLFDRYKIRRPFVMYAGGDEGRKNMPGLVTAFSYLPTSIRSKHQLVITGRIHAESSARLFRHAESAGMGADELVLTGYVSDEDLIALYNLCKLFVFPSLYEGFGLPVLEAMACGAAVIASNTTSIPEVVGRTDALFDSTRPEAITQKMKQALTDEGFRHSLREHGLEQTKKFSWDNSARDAIAAFEFLHRQELEKTQVTAILPKERPRLAFVSPLPPERSGISTYSAELLPELARFYDITLIIDQESISSPMLSAGFPARDVAWFKAHADDFDRILYQLGNSAFHKHMFALLSRHPGVVVLHDFYLSGAAQWMETTGYSPAFFRESLYSSHGYPALSVLNRNGAETAAWTYPCNRLALDEADGVIVHSKYAIDAARRWYGDTAASKLWHIPHLRTIPTQVDHRQARTELGFKPDDFLVCSFGMIGQSKLNHRLLNAWLDSPLARDKRCHLVFVGENEGGDYGRALLDEMANRRAHSRIRITGFVSLELYGRYLEAADAAVQLRALTRGETSRSVLDALAHGLALIINANGPMAEYPDDVLIKLQDDFSDMELIGALENLRDDSSVREQVGTAAQRYIGEFHNPGSIGEEYHRAIEHFAKLSQNAGYRALLNSLANLTTPVEPSPTDLLVMAETIASDTLQVRQKQLLVDTSVLVRGDAKSGIQRVVRSVLLELLASSPPGYRVEPVYCDGQRYRYARRFASDLLDLATGILEDDVVDAVCGDVYLGLDLSPHLTLAVHDYLKHVNDLGVKLYFVVCDILPMLHPEWWEEGMSKSFGQWFKSIAEVSTGIICISHSVVDSVGAWLKANPPDRVEPLSIGFFHLGADIENSLPTAGLPESAVDVLTALASAPTFVMVGSLVPRRGHRQTLSAFEALWGDGLVANLVVVGKRGWSTEVVEYLDKHPMLGKRLFWLEDISDEYLEKIYAASTCLIAASEAEGFGLPLVEAARKGLPIIARDIPVFREVAGDHAFYFSGMSHEDLAQAVMVWLDLSSRGKAPSSKDMPWLTWRESTAQLLKAVLPS
jgi:glycosyltransferase involved in cell wall biosynthesis